jgi:omega-hydroxy-beta-dihydromenaquinone-9 sulfotransferase
MKSAYLLYGIRLKMLFRLIKNNGFSFRSPYIFRFLFLLQNALWSSLFSVIEKFRYGEIITETPLPDQPVIIIGSWRTGSTYLHQLLQSDPNRTVPDNFQVHLPDSFLFSVKYYKPVMKLLMGKNARRTFDNVSVCADEPQEDEFAILKMCGQSPLMKLIYPDPNHFFLLNFEDYELEGAAYEEWKKAMIEFCTKINIATSKQIILKNPFHSLRIKTIRRLFPNAKFIHIYRHPFNVIPSSINMWNIVGQQNVMKPGFIKATVEDTVEVFDRVLNYINLNSKELPDQSYCEIKYENLEENPVEEIKRAYKKLGLPFSDTLEESIRQRHCKEFIKNKYSLSDEDKTYISEKLKHHMERYGYS